MTSFRMNAFSLCLALVASAGFSAASAADAPAKVSTALPGVSLLSPELDMPGLKRQRQVRLYLPPGYATSGKRYPVLYMHDAQNLFDNATSYAGEWKVDETLDALSKAGQLDLIVVGIDNGQERRMTELTPGTTRASARRRRGASTWTSSSRWSSR